MVEVYSMDKGREFFNNPAFREEVHADYVLSPISATIEMEYNGASILTVTCPLNDYFDDNDKKFDIGSVVRVETLPIKFIDDVDWEETSPIQLYSIYAIDINNYEVSFTAEPIINRMMRGQYLVDVRPTNLGQYGAWIYAIERSFGTPIMGWGGTGQGAGRNNTAYYQDINLLEATLGEQENSIKQRWGTFCAYDNNGLKFFYDNFESRPLKWTFAYGKDLTGIHVQYDGSAIIRWVRPKGYNGIAMSLNYTHSSGLAQNGGVWSPDVSSPIISDRTSFAPKKEVTFDNVKMRADVQSDEDTGGLVICDNQSQVNEALYNAVINMYNKEKVDKPNVTIDIDVVDLSKNTELEDGWGEIFKNGVSLGDKVRVFSSPHNIDIITRVINITYDCILDEITNITLSNSQYDFFQLLNNTVNTSQNVYNARIKE